MAKREYIQANKDWLEEKAKEEGVKALPKGIYYKVLSEGNQDSAKPTVRSIITASIQAGLSTASSLIAVVVVSLWLAACVISSRAGSSPFSRCTSVTSGNFTSLQKWATASSLSLASPVARLLFLKLNY